MYETTHFAIDVFFSLISAFCWGSWTNTIKFVRIEDFLNFYMDFGLSCIITAAIWAITIGTEWVGVEGSGGFFTTLTSSPDQWKIFYAFMAGIIFNAANLAIVLGIRMLGLAIAFPVAIGSAMVTGTLLLYILQPTGNAFRLFFGVGLACLAVAVQGLVHRFLDKEKSANDSKNGLSEALLIDNISVQSENNEDNSKGNIKGFILCLSGGIVTGCWWALDERSLEGEGSLDIYTSFFFLSLGTFLSCFLWCPILSITPSIIEKSNPFLDYFKLPVRIHLLGLVGGFLWATGTLLNQISGDSAGFAISYSIGQSAPLIGCLWGVFYFGEFEKATRKIYLLFLLMVILYMSSVISITMAHY